eukprot:8867694-Pyramimonas_sp.AAC.1
MFRIRIISSIIISSSTQMYSYEHYDSYYDDVYQSCQKCYYSLLRKEGGPPPGSPEGSKTRCRPAR